MSRTPIHGNPRNEYPQEALNRNLRELGLPEQNATQEELLKQVPIIGLLRSLGQQSQVHDRITNPELLHNTAGRALETNYQRGAPFDAMAKDDGIPMMSQGGMAGMDGMTSGPSFEPPEPEYGTAGVEIPEEIKEFVEKSHKTSQESRPDEAWRITPPAKKDSVAPYKRDEEGFESLPESVREEGPGSNAIPNYAEGGVVDAQAPDQWAAMVNPDEGPGPNEPESARFQPVDTEAIPAPAKPMAPPPPAAAPPMAPAPALTDQDFMNRANKMLGLGPDQQAGFMKLLGDRSQKAQLGAGLAGIGDAIASGGTLGKVNPGGMAKSEDLIQGKENAGINGMQTIRGNQEKAMEVADKLEARDPKSPLSKWAQKAYGDVGRKIGIDLSNASAAIIGDVTGKGVEALNTQYQNQLKMMGLDLQKKQVEATIGNQKAERDIAQQGRTLEAAKAAESRGIVDKAVGLLPWTTAHKADKAIEGALTNFSPDVSAYAQKHGITPEQAQAIKDKRVGGR